MNFERVEAPRTVRDEKVHLDEALVEAVRESVGDGKAVKATFDSVKEAKGVHTKLRTLMNTEGYGLRAWGPDELDDGTATITFLGKANKQPGRGNKTVE